MLAVMLCGEVACDPETLNGPDLESCKSRRVVYQLPSFCRACNVLAHQNASSGAPLACFCGLEHTTPIDWPRPSLFTGVDSRWCPSACQPRLPSLSLPSHSFTHTPCPNMYSLTPAILLASLRVAYAATAEQWRGRSIYQLITDRFALPSGASTNACDPGQQTWCGGNWNSIRENLDYIENAGFSAIWISPINQNYEGPRTAYGDPYHGYWIADVTKLNDRFGTEDDLKALVAEVHRRGMYIMVDVVVNNVMAPSLTPDWSKYMFKDPSFYHPYCPIQWGNATSEEECWMGDERVPLPDLDTRNPAVVSQYGDWIENLVREYEIDGLRIDAAKHVNMDFWPDFASRAGVFCMGEVFSGIEVDPVAQWQGPQALDSVLNFPMYQALADAFAIPGPQNMSALTVTLQEARSKFKDVSVLGNFLENHDVPRWHNKSVDPQSLYNAMVLSFMTDGIPVVYYGLEQGFAGAGDPYNREALWPSGYAETYTYKLMAKLNRVRNYLVSSTDWLDQETRIISSNDHAIAISKGHVITVATNIGSPPRNNTAIAFSTPYESSTPLTNIVTCQEWVVGSQGMAQVEYTKGGAAVVLVPNDVLESSGVCQDDSEPDDHSGLKASDYSNSAARPTTPWLSSLTGIMLIFIALRFY